MSAYLHCYPPVFVFTTCINNENYSDLWNIVFFIAVVDRKSSLFEIPTPMSWIGREVSPRGPVQLSVEC